MKNLTEVVFILDRSGSMEGLESDTIGGFNSMINKQNATEADVYVTTVLFNSESVVIHDRVSIKEIKPLDEEVYRVGGMTALLDAIGSTIKHISKEQKNAPKEQRPNKTLFVIITDGMENASKVYSYEKIKNMIEKRKEKNSWEFIFLGANIDAINVAGRIGIRRNRAANYHADRRGTRKNFEAVDKVISCCIEDFDICEEWKRDIDEDFEKREKVLPPWLR